MDDSSQVLLSVKKRRYNLAKFLRLHPGGSNTILNHYDPKGKNEIYGEMIKRQHSAAAFNLLKEYEISQANSNDLVDWSKPLLYQVGLLGKKYQEWVDNEPMDRKMILFENKIVEHFSTSTCSQIIIYWITVSILMIKIGLQRMEASNIEYKWFYLLITLIIGFLFWPILEYLVHRWVFHCKPPHNWPSIIRLHFLIHGQHHKLPFNKERVLFPIIPASVFGVIFYSGYCLVFPRYLCPTVFSGTIYGYLIYDLIHYNLHYGNPKEGSYFYYMKRYHNLHHFSHQHAGFGITSPVFDRLFQTCIYLRKLSSTLIWDMERNREILRN